MPDSNTAISIRHEVWLPRIRLFVFSGLLLPEKRVSHGPNLQRSTEYTCFPLRSGDGPVCSCHSDLPDR